MAKLKTCKHCGAQIAKNAKVCPQCGGKNKKPVFLRGWFIALVIVVVLIAVVGGNGSAKSNGTQQIGTVGQTLTGQAATGQSNGDSKKNEPTAEPKIAFNVGDILQDGDVQIVYVASGEYVSDNEYSQPKDGNTFIFLEFAFTNTGKSDASVSIYSFECYADGYNVDMYYGGDDDLSATLSTGRSVIGKIYFEVPKEAKQIEVEYSPNIFLDKKIKFVYEGNQDSGFAFEPNTSRTEGAISVGQMYETKSLRINYLSCEDFVSGNMFVQPKQGNHYISLIFEFENLGTSDKTITSYDFDCYADGLDCDQTFIRDDDLSATLSAGRKAKGTVTYEVPNDATVIEVEFEDNIWTSDRITFTVK